MNGILDGEYNVYGLDNNIIIQGQYENNKRDGKWIYYKKSGHIDSEIKYINGVAENQKKIDELETQLLDELEKNKGKIKNPMDEMYNAIPPK
jgi:antitoxin component YwqK of YwqJK toxin-antitoxin module